MTSVNNSVQEVQVCNNALRRTRVLQANSSAIYNRSVSQATFSCSCPRMWSKKTFCRSPFSTSISLTNLPISFWQCTISFVSIKMWVPQGTWLCTPGCTNMQNCKQRQEFCSGATKDSKNNTSYGWSNRNDARGKCFCHAHGPIRTDCALTDCYGGNKSRHPCTQLLMR